ncbi:MAG TPA: DUF3320 domain-containing protein [Planctomycetota bacterium]|nr:DUF3320 domain-containing protein [Planctomycetota bacterium]
MNTDGLSIELQHAPRLCYAMQQNAVPWLTSVRLHNPTPAALRDLRVAIELQPALAEPQVLHVAEVPAGGTVDLPVPDLRLVASALANTIERQRAELAVRVEQGPAVLATMVRSIDVLAYNEWPGVTVLPALLAAFVAPNHPALAPLLQRVAELLEQRTGSRALDGYQSRSRERALAMFGAVHDVVCACRITYVNPPPSFEEVGQKVRTPEQVVGERLATCLDLVLLYAALLEHIGLHPLVVLQHDHAFVGVWLQPGSTPEVELGPAVELRKRCDLGALAVLECTLACASAVQGVASAGAAARRRLDDGGAFRLAIDVAAARRAGVQPLPLRTLAFAAVDGPGGERPAPPPGSAREPGPAPAAPPIEQPPEQPIGQPEPAPAAKVPPKDRLEHWKSKLLDLTMFNRLLNFVETKKTVRLCPHDLEVLEDRLQQAGRMRVHARPAIGKPGADPRDLALAEQRSGVDVMREYLRDELRAGRLRAEHEAEDLDARLVEIFRHARTSLEESGANTLYLALGFLEWYESPQSSKPRRAPLLLLPLVIERLSVQDGFRFLLDDAEPRLNQTLLQMLQRDFDLRVGLGELPPEDEAGVDVRAVFDAFRTAVLAMPRWEVKADAHIGFFSFTKYLMWLDLAARDDLMQSPVLRHLVERPGAGYAQEVPEVPRDELDDLDPSEVYCPKDADSSQLAAVLAGAEGRTFVLEGPPGTGKSQTITNLIAQALANGKRVLFVAEKRAALEVVQRRLDDVGLGAFCLELHSSKSGPKAVLAQLARALDLGARREPAEWQRIAGELQHERQGLNEFVQALHRRREHDFSVFSAMSRLVALREASTVAMPSMRCTDAADVAAARKAVDALAAAAAALGVPEQETWWGVRRTDWTPALARNVVPPAQRLQRASETLRGAVLPVAEAFALDRVWGENGPGRAQLASLLELARLFRAPSLPPAALVRLADWNTVEPRLRQLLATGRRRDELWAPLAARWRRELLGLDLDRLHATSRTAAASFFVLRWWRLRGPRAELAAVSTAPRLGSAAAIAADLELALRVRTEERALAAAADRAAVFGPAWRDGLADWAELEAWLGWVHDVRQLLLKIVPGSTSPDPAVLAAVASQLDGLHAGSEVLPPRLGELRLAHDEFVVARDAIAALLVLDVDAAFGGEAAPGHLANVYGRTQRWLAEVPRLREHCAYEAAASAAAEHGAGELIAAHAAGALRTEQLQPTFERTLLETWLDEVHRREPSLATFRGREHARSIAKFAALDREAIRLAAEVVLARLCARLPQVRDTQVASSELGLLERELKKQRRHKPVRRLFAEAPGLIARLAPCMLMSPLSVAQFLGRAGTRFDLVLFDEASQIPMWDAVGAIGRGRSVVVVGDSHQLPPTTFFQRQAQDDEPGPDDVPEDLESVLDECGAAGLPRQHLDWHYRSRHESLIAFSNSHYYQNRLLTFPAPQQEAGELGVRCVLVAGVYDRAGSQQNRIEAEALVDEVVSRLRDPVRSRSSLGIVTFSRAQQVLIEDLLDRARSRHPEIEPAFGAIAEPVFVKNLENVQGDERDSILFSICYGPDAAGKIHENYGPLNLQGGERRLNVAVTRARRELVVFTSVRPEQVATRTAATGAKHLRTFLDYAMRGQAALAAAVAVDPSGEVESPFEAAVREALVARGHTVHAQVGCSGYRIDLAVLDPDADGCYLLGIECDGATYHSAATARDRDRLRAAVLQGLGWRLHRIWSTDFWQDPDGEIERVEAAIAEAKLAVDAARAAAPAGPGAAPPAQLPTDASAGEPTTAAATDESEPEPTEPAPPPAATLPDDPDGPRPYSEHNLAPHGTPEEFAEATALAALRAQAESVLAVASPLAFDRFARAIAAAWGIQRVTERVRERLRQALPVGAVEVDGVLWARAGDVEAFRGFRVPAGGAEASRAAEELPLVEVRNAMAWLLRQHQALAGDDLAREAARRFGIARLGNVVREVMQRALERLVADGRGVRDGEVVRWP